MCNYIHTYTAVVKATMNMKYNATLDAGKSKLFEYAVPKEGITVQLEVTKGIISFYGSHSNPDPSPVWHEYKLSSISSTTEFKIPDPMTAAHDDQKEQLKNTVPFYCKLVGMKNSIF